MKKFGILGISLTVAVLLAGCGSKSSESKTIAENTRLRQQVKSLKAEVKILKNQGDDSQSEEDSTSGEGNGGATTDPTAVMGKEYVIKDKSGKKLVGLTLTQADQKWSEFAKGDMDDSDFTGGDVSKLVQVSFHYTNYGLDEEWDPETGFSVYDDTGKKLDSNSYSDSDDGVSLGHSGTYTGWFILTKPYRDNKKLEIEFLDYLGESDIESRAKWTVD